MKSSVSYKSNSSPTINLFRLVAKIFDLHLPFLTTTLHLQLEFTLWICTILFTISSSLVLYKQTYLHTFGDWVFLFTVGAWLGRHFLLRLVCTITWVDPPATGVDGSCFRGSRRRRRAFDTWLLRHQRQQSLYHRIRWLLSFLSPYNIIATLVKFVQTCAMAGQYCDASAATGVASAAMMMLVTSGGGDDNHLHYGHNFSKSSSTHHSHGQHGAMLSFGPRPKTNNSLITSIILALSRSWGTLCGLSFATWSLLRGERGYTRGAIAEVVALVGGVFWIWTMSCLSFFGLPTLSSSRSELRSGFGSELSMSGVVSGNTNKRNRTRKQSTQAHIGDSQPHSSSQNCIYSEAGRSLDVGNGKLTFRLFPSVIRSRALHIQQTRTSDMYRALESIWEACPPSQLIVAVIATITLCYGCLFVLGGYDFFLGNIFGGNDGDYQTPNFKGNLNLNQNHDLFQKGYHWRNQSPFPAPHIFDAEPPSLVTLIFLVVSFGTAASLFLFGRVLLPIPEFVAGTNVLKAIRAETRMRGGNGVGVGKYPIKDLPWAENYKSITIENRLRLYYKVAIVRILENVLLCAILPQTQIICRITEHCEQGALLWGPSGVTGIAGRRFGKRASFLASSFDVLTGNNFVTRLIATSLVLVTAIILVAQMTLMNRTYLAIMGYISGEWELVTETSEGQEDDIFISLKRFCPKFDLFGIGSKLPARRSNTLMQWDPKRRYQKGDRIVNGDFVYEAVSNSPEGSPFDPFLRAAHDLFCDELGHPSASNTLVGVLRGCSALAGMQLTAILIWRNDLPLVLTFAATLIAWYGMNHSRQCCCQSRV